jgi:GR25 family glycosyltransferase involved in LPS biosynthesis
MKSLGIGFYFINLDERVDRFETFVEQFKNTGIQINRISAIPSSSLILEENTSPPGVSACWKSHQKVYKEFINSQDTHAVIFEDDAIIDKKTIDWLRKINQKNFRGIDLFQFGYLKTNNNLYFTNFDPAPFRILDLRRYLGFHLSRVDFIFRNWIKISRIFVLLFLRVIKSVALFKNEEMKIKLGNFTSYFENERKLRKRVGLNDPLIYNSFEAGAHAYVIGREFAKIMVNFNDPVLLPADLCFMGIARAQNFRIIRNSKSLCKQSHSISSISSRTYI